MVSVEQDAESTAVRDKVLQAVRILYRMGLFELNSGHVSARVPGTNAAWILGHLHTEDTRAFDEVGVDDLTLLDLDTLRWRGRRAPADEMYIHTAVYAVRPEVQAVVHTHAEYPVALSIADRSVLPVHHHGAIFAPEVPVFPNHRQIETPELGRDMAAALGGGYAVVLRAHGAVTVGASAEEAVMVMHTLHECARLQWLASQVGTPRPIDLGPDVRRTPSRNRVRNIWHVYSHGYDDRS